jgi:hypothetical protein
MKKKNNFIPILGALSFFAFAREYLCFIFHQKWSMKKKFKKHKKIKKI